MTKYRQANQISALPPKSAFLQHVEAQQSTKLSLLTQQHHRCPAQALAVCFQHTHDNSKELDSKVEHATPNQTGIVHHFSRTRWVGDGLVSRLPKYHDNCVLQCCTSYRNLYATLQLEWPWKWLRETKNEKR